MSLYTTCSDKDTIATSISGNIGKSVIKVPFMNDNFKQTIDVIIDHNKLFESSNYNNKVLATILSCLDLRYRLKY